MQNSNNSNNNDNSTFLDFAPEIDMETAKMDENDQ